MVSGKSVVAADKSNEWRKSREKWWEKLFYSIENGFLSNATEVEANRYHYLRGSHKTRRSRLMMRPWAY